MSLGLSMRCRSFLKNPTSGLWSVHTSNVGIPLRKYSHLCIAHCMASSSSSIVAYLPCASVNDVEPHCIIEYDLSGCSCTRQNPSPNSLDASVIRIVCSPSSNVLPLFLM